jgi:phospholipid/cholesterol/gamma-HCH transport system ATP-binding protein
VAHHEREGTPLVDLTAIPEEEVDQVRLSWAVVFQKNALFSDTVYENCALWLREHTELSEAEIEARVRESLEAVALDPEDVIHKDRDELSGGMAKRVAVARAMVIDPLVLFYDEPTTGLDPVSAAHIHELIWDTHHRPRADGSRRTTVLVTHDRDLLRRVHPRVVMLHETHVCFDGTYEEFQASDLEPTREYLERMPELHMRGGGAPPHPPP